MSQKNGYFQKERQVKERQNNEESKTISIETDQKAMPGVLWRQC